MVSVIVTMYDSQKYLVRCINSIKRQSYKEKEIIIVAKGGVNKLPMEDGIKVVTITGGNKVKAIAEALELASGELVYFCSSDSVTSTNALEKMIAEESAAICPAIRAYTPVFEDYELNKIVNISIGGKLFQKERIKKVMAEIPGENYNELDILVNYLLPFEKVVQVDDAVLYDSVEDNLTKNTLPKETDNNYWKNLLKDIKNKCSNDRVRNYITEGIGYGILKSRNDAEELLEYAEKELHDDIWLNYSLLSKNVKAWWDKLQKTESSKIYDKMISYLAKYEGELVLDMILGDYNMNKSLYEIMKNNDQTTFFNVYRRVNGDVNISVDLSNIGSGRTAGYAYELTGMQLADYVIDKYKTGGLGLMTLIKSGIAWLKRKI